MLIHSKWISRRQWCVPWKAREYQCQNALSSTERRLWAVVNLMASGKQVLNNTEKVSGQQSNIATLLWTNHEISLGISMEFGFFHLLVEWMVANDFNGVCSVAHLIHRKQNTKFIGLLVECWARVQTVELICLFHDNDDGQRSTFGIIDCSGSSSSHSSRIAKKNVWFSEWAERNVEHSIRKWNTRWNDVYSLVSPSSALSYLSIMLGKAMFADKCSIVDPSERARERTTLTTTGSIHRLK